MNKINHKIIGDCKTNIFLLKNNSTTIRDILKITQYIGLISQKSIAIFLKSIKKEAFIQKLLCLEAGIDPQKLKTDEMKSDDWHKISNTMSEFISTKIYLCDKFSTACDIEKELKKMEADDSEPDVVIIESFSLKNPC